MNDTELELRYLREMVTALRRRIAELAPLDPMGDHGMFIHEREKQDLLAERAKAIHWLLGKADLLRFEVETGHPWGENHTLSAKCDGKLISQSKQIISPELLASWIDASRLRDHVREQMCQLFVSKLMEAP